MSQFRPTRASPRLKPANITDPPPHQLSVDTSRSSIASAHELSALSGEEIELIDSVIARAGPSATTFLTVFKAYNDVLTERGLDPHEVIYYGKLLKLGTMKGKNWGDKWNVVKSQYNLQVSRGDSNDDSHSHGQTQTSSTGPKNAFKRVVYRAKLPSESDDTFTVHSHANESDMFSTGENDVRAPPHHTPKNSAGFQNAPSWGSPSFSNHIIGVSSPPVHKASSVSRFRRKKSTLEESHLSDDSNDVPSTTPPSYHATTRDIRPTNRPALPPISRAPSQLAPAITSSAEARKIIAMARERRGSVVNEKDAWKKIKMQRDEADADQFRADRLQERCWDVWKQGFHWIITTHRQISEARGNLLLRLSLQRWRNITMSRKALYQRVTSLSNNRCLRIALDAWKARLTEKEQLKWRDMMRSKMKTIKAKREMKLIKNIWAKWRQSYRSHLSDHQYTKQLQFRYYRQWKIRLSVLIENEIIADNFSETTAQNAMKRCWHLWLSANEMGYRERVMTERIELRLLGKTLFAWRKKMQDSDRAKVFSRLLLLKSSIRSWKVARDRIRNMEMRATKHIARQDGVLLRAVARVWKARERGQLLDRVKTARILKSSWAIWKDRVQRQKQDEDLAIAFSFRGNGSIVASSFRDWHAAFTTHQNAHSFASQYNASQLQDKMILLWRIELREKLKLVKMARRVDKVFAIRRAWKTWVGAMKTKAMTKRVKEMEQRWLEKHFHVWLDRTRGEKRRRMAEQTIKRRSNERVLRYGLATWTNRVIEIKLRELDVAQRHDHARLSLAFKKWKDLRARHVEELSLMESYQYVKREETMRRLFHRWLSLALTTRRRRVGLQQKEEEMRILKITAAWDKWRDRFIDEKLRPIEHNAILQSRKNLLFRAFGLWHSKTKSLPAIRFYTTNTKFKYFQVWRRGMPKALQAKGAREMDRKAVYTKFMGKWLQSLRTKRALKAVARARYLRLAPAPRQPRPAVSGPSTARPTWLSFPKPADNRNVGQPADVRTGLVSLSRTHSGSGRSPESVVSSSGRREVSPRRSRSPYVGRGPGGEVSPTRSGFGSGLSTASGEGGRSRLWRELREVQRKPGPPSTRERF